MTPPFAFTAFTRSWAAASAGPSNGAMPPLLSNAQPITIGFAAADAVPATSATAATAAARSASERPLLARVHYALLGAYEDRTNTIGVMTTTSSLALTSRYSAVCSGTSTP